MVMADCSTATGSRRVKAMVASGKVASSGPSCSRCWGVLSTQRLRAPQMAEHLQLPAQERVVRRLVEAQVVVAPGWGTRACHSRVYEQRSRSTSSQSSSMLHGGRSCISAVSGATFRVIS